jgi:hypothetical protein
MTRIPEKIAYKILNYLGNRDKDGPLKTAVMAVGLRAAVKFLHYQSMKGIYEAKEEYLGEETSK